DESFALPVGVAKGERAQQIAQRSPQAVIARLRAAGSSDAAQDGVLFDAVADLPSSGVLLEAMARGMRARSAAGQLIASLWARDPASDPAALEPRPLKAPEQSSAVALFGDRYLLKLRRHLEEAAHAEIDLGRFLAS